jgi:hypothetical protein
VFVQCLAGWYLRNAHGERLAMGDVRAQERFPVDQTPFGHVFVWLRFPLASAFLDDDRFTDHPLVSSASGELQSSLSPYRWVNNLHPSNFLGVPARRTAKNPPSRVRGQMSEMPLSKPTLPRSTPIATTALRFSVRLDTEGMMDLRLTA